MKTYLPSLSKALIISAMFLFSLGIFVSKFTIESKANSLFPVPVVFQYAPSGSTYSNKELLAVSDEDYLFYFMLHGTDTQAYPVIVYDHVVSNGTYTYPYMFDGSLKTVNFGSPQYVYRDGKEYVFYNLALIDMRAGSMGFSPVTSLYQSSFENALTYYLGLDLTQYGDFNFYGFRYFAGRPRDLGYIKYVHTKFGFPYADDRETVIISLNYEIYQNDVLMVSDSHELSSGNWSFDVPSLIGSSFDPSAKITINMFPVSEDGTVGEGKYIEYTSTLEVIDGGDYVGYSGSEITDGNTSISVSGIKDTVTGDVGHAQGFAEKVNSSSSNTTVINDSGVNAQEIIEFLQKYLDLIEGQSKEYIENFFRSDTSPAPYNYNFDVDMSLNIGESDYDTSTYTVSLVDSVDTYTSITDSGIFEPYFDILAAGVDNINLYFIFLGIPMIFVGALVIKIIFFK